MNMSRLWVFNGSPSFVDGAAAFIAEAATKAIAERGLFTLALSGGGTPKSVYARLAREDYRQRLAWDRVQVFFGDERCVPPDDLDSNYRMARETWLDQGPIPVANIHRIRGEDDPVREALRYEQEIRALFRTAACPVFDLILLGLGDNGHTASLFPGTASLRERERLVAAQYVEVMRSWRVTFTAPLINAARSKVFLVQGAGKARILWNVREGPYQPDVWPAQLIEPAGGELHWLTDSMARTR